MLFSTIVDYVHGRLTEKCIQQGNKRKARYVVLSSVIINLLLLCFFKYTDFLIGNINLITGMNLPLLNLPLPLGISFYTFQTMSYTIDIYRGEARAQHNIIDFGSYVAMFPQLVAGPIVRYQTVDEELRNRQVTTDEFAEGIRRFTYGLGKKVLLANQAGLIWEAVLATSQGEAGVLLTWLGAIAFGLQIYFDFLGYSDMAIGLGLMMGFHFPENFHYPYESGSITEFWRRWHMSLGTWFREYVYIPLGGNRKGKLLTYRNILIVWCLTGIWHGAGWNFLMWGLIFAVLLMLEKAFLLKTLQKAPKAVGHIYTLFFLLISWVFFANDSIKDAFIYIGKMFGFGANGLLGGNVAFVFTENWFLLIVLILFATSLPERLLRKVPDQLRRVFILVFVLIIWILGTAYLVNAGYNPFLYFRF